MTTVHVLANWRIRSNDTLLGDFDWRFIDVDFNVVEPFVIGREVYVTGVLLIQ